MLIRWLCTSTREKRLLGRDHVLRGSFGNVRFSLVNATNTMLTAQRKWKMNETATTIWGGYMAGCVMLSSFYKGEERIKAVVQSKDMKESYVEAMSCGEVRGYCHLDSHKSTTDNAFHVHKILYNQTSPYTTTVRATGHPATDWRTYYESSEQVDTGVEIKSDSSFCGGITLQKMPVGCPEGYSKALEALSESSIVSTESTLTWIRSIAAASGNGAINLHDCQRIPLDYFCRCSKTSFLKQIHSTQIPQLIQTGGFDATCAFCNATHSIAVEDLKLLV